MYTCLFYTISGIKRVSAWFTYLIIYHIKQLPTKGRERERILENPIYNLYTVSYDVWHFEGVIHSSFKPISEIRFQRRSICSMDGMESLNNFLIYCWVPKAMSYRNRFITNYTFPIIRTSCSKHSITLTRRLNCEIIFVATSLVNHSLQANMYIMPLKENITHCRNCLLLVFNYYSKCLLNPVKNK